MQKTADNMLTWHQQLLELAEDGLAWCTCNSTDCVSIDFHTAQAVLLKYGYKVSENTLSNFFFGF